MSWRRDSTPHDRLTLPVGVKLEGSGEIEVVLSSGQAVEVELGVRSR